MPGGRSGLYLGIEKKHQSAEYKQYEAENDILRTAGRDHLLDLVRAENEGRLVAPSNEPLTAAQQFYNDKCSWRELELKLAANFSAHDLVLTLTYDDLHLPQDKRDADKSLQKFIRKLRAARRRRDEKLRYVYMTEGWHGKSEDDYFGGDGRLEDRRLHHHMVLNSVGPGDLEEIRSLWIGGGYVRVEPVDVYYYRELAKYLTKEAREFSRAKPGERSWRASRNLAAYEDAGITPEEQVGHQQTAVSP